MVDYPQLPLKKKNGKLAHNVKREKCLQRKSEDLTNYCCKWK